MSAPQLRLFLFVMTCAWTGIVSGTGQHETASSASAETGFDMQYALEASQRAIGQQVGSYAFTDGDGNSIQLRAFQGKPLVVSMIYTSCFHTCPMLTSYLAGVVDLARDALGDESFYVVSIGFDTEADTPQRMRMFAADRGIDMPEWHFLSGDEPTVDALARDIGFVYERSPSGFDHLAQTTVLDGAGVVANQIYSGSFDPPMLIEALKYLLRGELKKDNTLSSWINNARLLCTVYDPASGRYRFDYSLIIAFVLGLACLGAVAVFIARAWLAAPTVKT